MKVFLELPLESRGLQRVYDALVKFKPNDIEITRDPKQADLVIIHVIGRNDRVSKLVAWLRAQNKPYAMIQYCIRSTKNPDTKDWIDLWNEAELVWSYYDLPELCREDGTMGWISSLTNDLSYGNFYHAPLGVDPKVFHHWGVKQRRYIVAACSQSYLTESAKECVQASRAVNRQMFFLGDELSVGDDIVCASNISDEKLAQYYSDCEYVSGLRRIEGFEQPALEGLMCGARPIFFDKPHYRQWFNDFALFIPEEPRDKVVESLIKIFQQDAQPVSTGERQNALKRFDWQTIIDGFWERLLT